MAFAGRSKVPDNPITLCRGGVDGHQIVVVEVHTPCPYLGQQRDGVDRRQRIAHNVAEGIAAAVADGPKTERKLVLWAGRELVRHEFSDSYGTRHCWKHGLQGGVHAAV